MLLLIFYSLVGGVFSLAAALFLLWRAELAKKIITPLLAFAAGAFLGAVFLDILPEALEHTLQNTNDIRPVMISLIVGFLLFFVIERLLMRFMGTGRNRTKHEDHTETLPALLIIGDSLHNFLDGALIGIAYLVNPVLGFTVAISTAAHELPQEIGDFTVLLSAGWSKKRILFVNVFQSLMTIPGALIAYYAGSHFENIFPYLLAGVSGIFLYLAAVNLVPKINHDASHSYTFRVIIPLIIGIVLVGGLVEIAHSMAGHDHDHNHEDHTELKQHEHNHNLDNLNQLQSSPSAQPQSSQASASASPSSPSSPSSQTTVDGVELTPLDLSHPTTDNQTPDHNHDLDSHNH